jgi:deoxycytidine triphosphate deaminase
MLLILSGPSAVGKSFCVDFLCSRYGFKTLVPFTSRAGRITEAEGIHYHFRSREDLKALSNNFSLGYWGWPFDDHDVYGYTAELDAVVSKPHNYVIQASTRLAKQIQDKHHSDHARKRLILAFLDFQSLTVLDQKLSERFPDQADRSRRMRHAAAEIAHKDSFDIRIAANEPFAIAHSLLDELRNSYDLNFPGLFEPPLFGAMSDVDIQDSLNDEADGLHVRGLETGHLAEKIHGWSLDLTLGPHYWRVVPGAKVFDLAAGNEADLDARFEKQRFGNSGLTLAPNEMILATTQEHLVLPKSIVGIFAGRTSYANIGLSVELSQIILQPGHDSPVRLQIRNSLPYPIVLYAGMTVVQVVFFRLQSPASRKYIERVRAHYKTSDDVVSKYYKDPILETIRARRRSVAAFPWSTAYEVALLACGVAVVVAFLARVFDLRATERSAEFSAGLMGIPILITQFRKLRQARWR